MFGVLSCTNHFARVCPIVCSWHHKEACKSMLYVKDVLVRAAWLGGGACVHELARNSSGACKMTSRSLWSAGREFSYYCQIMPQLKRTHYHACHKTSVPTWLPPSMLDAEQWRLCEKRKKPEWSKWISWKNCTSISAFLRGAAFSGYAKESFLLIGKRRINLSPKCFWHKVNFFLNIIGHDWVVWLSYRIH